MQISGNTGSGILKLILTSEIFGQILLVIIFIFSVVSFAIIIFKLLQFRKVGKGSREFLSIFSHASNIRQIYLSTNNMDNPLSTLVKEGYDKFEEIKREKSDLLSDRPALLNLIDRRLKSTIEDEITYYEGYLPFLATTSTVAPFLGLLGTVTGIIYAFQQIGIEGTGNIAVLAPGVAGALLTTAAGLVTAIPAVIGYNYLLNRIRKMASQMDVFSVELMASLEVEIWSSGSQEKDRGEIKIAGVLHER